MLIESLNPFVTLLQKLRGLFDGSAAEPAQLGSDSAKVLEEARIKMAALSAASRKPIESSEFVAAVDDKGEAGGAAQTFNKMLSLVEEFKAILRERLVEAENGNFIGEKSREALKLLFEGMQKLIMGSREGGIHA